MEKAVKITWIITGAIVLLALLGVFIVMQFAPVTNTLTANGIATLKVSPDIISIYFDIETNGTSATIAKDANAVISDKFTKALINIGITGDRIQTQSYNIYPWQEYNGNSLVDKGYKASNQIKVILNSSENEKIGEVIDTGVNSGALINYINFELSNDKQNEYKAQALKQAGEDAKIKAEAIASGLNKKLGRLISVSSSDFNYYPWPIYNNRGGTVMAEAASAKIAATSITPGEQDVSASISVVYRIE